jgi:hypothetical protein
MAEKHEANPSRPNNSEFRQCVEVGSASSWTAFNLDLFGVLYEKDTYDELPNVVYESDVTEYDQKLERRNAYR